MIGHIKVFVFFYTAMVLGFLLYMNLSYGDDEKAFTALRNASARLPVGSGAAILTPKGKVRVITNFHVCLPSMVEGTVRATDEKGNSGNGHVYKLSPVQDLCLVDAPPSLVPLHVAPSNSFFLKEVYTRGYPLGVLTNSKGVVLDSTRFRFVFPIPEGFKCKEPRYDLHTNIQVGCLFMYTNSISTIYSQPGSSGSPVVNSEGDLVGVVQTYAPRQGAGFIPLSDVKEFLKGE